MDPVGRRIMDNLLDALGAIEAGETYSRTYTVLRTRRDGNYPIGDNTLIVHRAGRSEEETPPTGSDGYFLEVLIHAFTLDPDGGDHFDDALEAMETDVIRALAQDPSRGDLAMHTYWRQTLPIVTPHAVGVEMLFEIHYRTALDDPTTAIA